MSSKNSLSNQQRIAENLNISRTTVSRCFTNHSGVNPDTRAKVFSEAKRLGYTYLEQRNIKKKPQLQSELLFVLTLKKLMKITTKVLVLI